MSEILSGRRVTTSYAATTYTVDNRAYPINYLIVTIGLQQAIDPTRYNIISVAFYKRTGRKE